MTPDERMHWVAGVLAIGLLILNAAITVILMIYPIPPENQTIVGQLVGGSLSLLGVCVAFFYGSSQGTRKMQDTLDTQAKSIKEAQTTLSATAPGTPGKVELHVGDEVKVEAVKEDEPK